MSYKQWYSLTELKILKGLILIKTDKSKECQICHYNYFDNGFKSDSKSSNRCDCRIKYFGNFAVITVNDFSYRFFMFDMTEEDVIEFIKDFEPDDEFETTLRYKRIDISKAIDINKTSSSRKYMICHYWDFKDLEFKCESSICNKSSIGCIFSKSKRIEILNIKGDDYRCILCDISRNKTVNILNNSLL